MTTWTNQPEYSGAASDTYDSSSITYDSATYNYDGQVITTWTNTNKS